MCIGGAAREGREKRKGAGLETNLGRTKGRIDGD